MNPARSARFIDRVGMDEVTGEPITGMVPSIMRRVFGCGVLFALGALLIYIAFVRPPEALQYIVVLLGFGGVALWAGSEQLASYMLAEQPLLVRISALGALILAGLALFAGLSELTGAASLREIAATLRHRAPPS